MIYPLFFSKKKKKITKGNDDGHEGLLHAFIRHWLIHLRIIGSKNIYGKKEPVVVQEIQLFNDFFILI